jgi:hypothetical protein
MLEPYASRGARTDLRGGSRSNPRPLPGESGVIQEKNLSESKVALVYGQMVRHVPYNL